MAIIHFEPERWQKIKETYHDFWQGKLDRPVFGVAIREYPLEKTPDIPLLCQANCHDFSITPEQIADRIFLEQSQYAFYGDAFPMFNLDCFGPGVVAAFLGAKLDNSTGQVWFHPTKKKPISDLSFAYDPDNVWLKRVNDIYDAVFDRFGGQILMGLPDLGGAMDLLSTFLPGELLLFELYDNPEEVKHATQELAMLWRQYFNEFTNKLRDRQAGYTNWSSLFSVDPAYILQCDFSYMIGPDMFEEFVLPTLQTDCDTIANTFYHLDGVGELPHLDHLLSIQSLNGVQWVPGAGNPEPDYPDYIKLYQKIHRAGKSVMLQHCDITCLQTIVDQIGSAGVYHPIMYHEASEKEYLLSMLVKLGIRP